MQGKTLGFPGKFPAENPKFPETLIRCRKNPGFPGKFPAFSPVSLPGNTGSRKPCREMRDLTQSLHILRTLESFPVSFPGLSLVFPGSCREIFRELIKISGNRCTGFPHLAKIFSNFFLRNNKMLT